MKTLLPFVAAVAVLLPAAASAAGPRDSKALAARIVTSVAAVKEGEVVLVRGTTDDAELLEDLTLAARKVGALPLLLMSRPGSDKRWFQESPAKYDATVHAAYSKLLDFANVEIAIEDMATPLPEVGAERIKVVDETIFRLMAQRTARGVRYVSLGNGLYPSEQNAKLLAIPKDELANVYWDALATDPKRLAAAGEAVRAVLVGAKELRLTSAKGTDLKVNIEKRPVAFSSGALGPEAIKKGGTALQLWLPSGEAWVSPVPGTAEGKIFVERLPYEDGAIEELALTFAGGKVTSVKAKPSKLFAVWKARYDAAPACRAGLAVVDFGINPEMKPKTPLLNYVVPGMVMVQIGGAPWAEGAADCSYASQFYLPGHTVSADGKPLVDKGELKAIPK